MTLSEIVAPENKLLLGNIYLSVAVADFFRYGCSPITDFFSGKAGLTLLDMFSIEGGTATTSPFPSPLSAENIPVGQFGWNNVVLMDSLVIR